MRENVQIALELLKIKPFITIQQGLAGADELLSTDHIKVQNGEYSYSHPNPIFRKPFTVTGSQEACAALEQLVKRLERSNTLDGHWTDYP